MKILYPYFLLKKISYNTNIIDYSEINNLLLPVGILAVTGITFITACVIYSNYYVISDKVGDTLKSDTTISDETRDIVISHLSHMLRSSKILINARTRMKASFSADVEKQLLIFKEHHPNIEYQELIRFVHTKTLLSNKYGANSINLVEYLNNVNDLSPKVLNTLNNINVYLYIGDKARQNVSKDNIIKEFFFDNQKEMAKSEELSKIVNTEFIKSIHDEFIYRSLIHSADAVNLIVEAGILFNQ